MAFFAHFVLNICDFENLVLFRISDLVLRICSKSAVRYTLLIILRKNRLYKRKNHDFV